MVQERLYHTSRTKRHSLTYLLNVDDVTGDSAQILPCIDSLVSICISKYI